jgi:hypothetical protein
VSGDDHGHTDKAAPFVAPGARALAGSVESALEKHRAAAIPWTCTSCGWHTHDARYENHACTVPGETVPQLRTRLEAALRLLVIDGHVSPQGARSIRQVLRAEVSS